MSKEIPKETFSDDYVCSCARYILGIKTGTSADYLLVRLSNELHSEEVEKTPMTYAECCDRIKTLVDRYEREDGK